MAEAVLLSARDGAIAEFRLNRPGTKNSLNEELVDSLGAALEAAARAPEVRVIVLTGGTDAFCSGVDLRSAAADLGQRERLEQRLTGFHRLIRAITSADKPVIAAIAGPAVGFGADLALACDLRVAATSAYFEEKFVAIGLMPDGGGTFHLSRFIGLGRALEHLMLGTRFDAATALSLGLVNRVVEPADLHQETRAICERLAAAPPLALGAIKRAVRASLDGSLDSALERERREQLALLATADVREGVSAFLERRTPVFQGR